MKPLEKYEARLNAIASLAGAVWLEKHKVVALADYARSLARELAEKEIDHEHA